MSTTTTINPTGASNTSGKKNFATQAAAVTAAAAAGAAGMAAVNSEVFNSEENIEDIQEVTENQTVQDAIVANDTSSDSSVQATQPQASTSVNESVIETVEEIEPITNQPSSSYESSVELQEPTSTEIEEVTESQQGEPVENTVDESVNPDEIADAIISEDQIDPNDIDMEDVINFDEIGTVYAVNGESYTAASFHDASGAQMVMVDVDGDDVFDLVTDFNGNIIAEVPGTVTVDDAEINVVDDGSYLAHNEDEVTDQFGSESIAQDMIS